MRRKDPSGVSGLGLVAEVVEFSNGKVAISWLDDRGPGVASVTIHDSMSNAEAVHGHDGDSVFVPVND